MPVLPRVTMDPKPHMFRSYISNLRGDITRNKVFIYLFIINFFLARIISKKWSNKMPLVNTIILGLETAISCFYIYHNNFFLLLNSFNIIVSWFRLYDFFTGESVIMGYGLYGIWVKNVLMLDLFQLLSSPDVNWWTGVLWITCGLLWGQKVVLEHTSKTSANGQLARTVSSLAFITFIFLLMHCFTKDEQPIRVISTDCRRWFGADQSTKNEQKLADRWPSAWFVTALKMTIYARFILF